MTTLEFTKLSPALGAEVRGLDPTKTPDEETRRTLQALFDEHAVLVFRDLELDRRKQTYLTELVRGEQDLSDDKIAADADRQSTFYISNRIEAAAAPFGRLMFHSDGMWSEYPFEVLSLWGEEVEQPVPPNALCEHDPRLGNAPGRPAGARRRPLGRPGSGSRELHASPG